MRTISSFLILFSLIAFTACNDGSENGEGHDHDTNHDNDHGQMDHDAHEGSGPVMMNDGEQWQADASTNEGIADMKAIMAKYHGGELESIDTLNSRLQAKFQEIFDKCSMEGEAHDQLHNYLLPMKDIFSKLETCERTECDQLTNKLGEHLASYQTYFK